LRAIKSLGQKEYKIVLVSKEKLKKDLHTHISNKIKAVRNYARKEVLSLKKKAKSARSYMKKANKAKVALKTKLVNGKYAKMDKFASLKHTFNKYRAQNSTVMKRWKRGVNRYMEEMFANLKGNCSLTEKKKGKSSALRRR